MKTRQNSPETKLRSAERAYRADPSQENYARFAEVARRSGKPLVQFGVARGASGLPPHDPDTRAAVWLTISLSGRALPEEAGVREDEWVYANLAQFAGNMEPLVRMIADAMNASEAAQAERWNMRPEINSMLRLSAVSRSRRIHELARSGAAFPEIYRDAGFDIEHTGGGCTAWTLYAPDGGHVMITSESSVPEWEDDEILVGLYDNEGNDILLEEFKNTEAGAREAVAFGVRSLAGT